MKKFLIIILIFLYTPVFAYFSYNDFSTRSIALGGTGVARLRNSDALFYNPALLSQLRRFHFSFNYNHLYPDLINNSIHAFNASSSYYINNGSAGIGVYNFSSDHYNEKMAIIGYGHDFNIFQAGLNLKYGLVDFAGNVKYDPLINTDNLIFYTFDIGLLYRYQFTSIGISVLNCVGNENGLSYKEAPEKKINLGISQIMNKSFIVNGELCYIEDYINYKIGVSFIIFPQYLTLNSGLNKQKFSFGLSTSYQQMSLDYTSEYSLLFSELKFSQMIGIRFYL